VPYLPYVPLLVAFLIALLRSQFQEGESEFRKGIHETTGIVYSTVIHDPIFKDQLQIIYSPEIFNQLHGTHRRERSPSQSFYASPVAFAHFRTEHWDFTSIQLSRHIDREFPDMMGPPATLRAHGSHHGAQ
jgi:hypothetical protein